MASWTVSSTQTLGHFGSSKSSTTNVPFVFQMEIRTLWDEMQKKIISNAQIYATASIEKLQKIHQENIVKLTGLLPVTDGSQDERIRKYYEKAVLLGALINAKVFMKSQSLPSIEEDMLVEEDSKQNFQEETTKSKQENAVMKCRIMKKRIRTLEYTLTNKQDQLLQRHGHLLHLSKENADLRSVNLDLVRQNEKNRELILELQEQLTNAQTIYQKRLSRASDKDLNESSGTERTLTVPKTSESIDAVHGPAWEKEFSNLRKEIAHHFKYKI